MRDYILMCQFSHVKEKKKEKKGQERKGIRLWHLRKKRGKLLSGMYYRGGRCLASSAFQCLHYKNRNKTGIYLDISRKQTKKMIRK